MKTTRISIYLDDVWAGDGRIADGEIVDCAAVLGPDQDASDETYEAIQDAIQDAIDAEPADRYTGTGEVQRPDGVYSWTIR